MILRKYPESRYNRGKFMYYWCQEFLEVGEFGITKSKFLEFWEHEAALERTLRDLLKEPEFKLQPEQEAKRREKQAEFRRWKQNLKDKEDFEKVFGEKTYDEEME